ncbi:hypothetical protein D8666_01415 [Ochrobactrum soli]|nr:hypothetical protein D8666_01415 [[Ochrobactrum] soli]
MLRIFSENGFTLFGMRSHARLWTNSKKLICRSCIILRPLPALGKRMGDDLIPNGSCWEFCE